jgi:hypothetical protein
MSVDMSLQRWSVSVVASVALCGCCSSATLDRARARARALEAEVISDRHVNAPPIGDCAGVPVVTVDELARGLHVDERVALDGEPVIDSARRCTLLACEDECGHELPCCNDCTGGYRLITDRKRTFVTMVGKDLFCGGNKCAMQCQPFGTHPRRRYRFVGRFTEVRSIGEVLSMRFEIESWCRAP